jgi:curli biogenesis system outer membrane secretion channel CsgG
MKTTVCKRAVVYGLTAMLTAVPFSVTNATAAGLKKVVAVSRFENKSGDTSETALGDNMADQLSDALVQSGEFIVVERKTLDDVQDEQKLAASGQTAASKTAKAGKLIAAQALVKGSITEFESKSAGNSSGFGFGPLSVGNKHDEAHVGLIIQLVDTSTGQVLDSQRVEGKVASGGTSVGVNVGVASFGQKGFSKTPMGKAVQMAIDNAVQKISARLRSVPFEARVIKVSMDGVFVNAGSRSGTSVGDRFALFSVGEALVDPDSGESLGVDEKKVGTITVTDVQEKYAKAKLDSTFQVKTGDIVKVDTGGPSDTSSPAPSTGGTAPSPSASPAATPSNVPPEAQ